MGDRDIIDFYAEQFDEAPRLDAGSGLLEFLRTKQIIRPHLRTEPLAIADIGGGPGIYAQWLADLGHHVTLLDPVPRHIDAALATTPTSGSITARAGDARSIDLDDATADVVLLLGPLYHLPQTADREAALDEAYRVLRPGGHLFAAAISRFASIHDGLASRWLTTEGFRDIATTDLRTGRHENPTRQPGWFTTAYFHRPNEFRHELKDSGFNEVEIHGIEGIAGWFTDLDSRLADAAQTEIMLEALDRLGTEPSLVGASAHLLGHALKPD